MSYMPYNAKHERKEAAALVAILLENGCSVSVNDGMEWILKRSTDAGAILAALGSTDSDSLRWHNAAGDSRGAFWLIYGNDPGELVADHTANDACETAWNRLQDAVGAPR